MKRILDFLDRLSRIRILQHFLFWCLSFLVLVNILRVSSNIQPIDVIYAAVFHLPILLVVYINHFILIPNFLGPRRFIIYSFLLAGNIIVGWCFYSFLFGRWIDTLLPGYYFITYYNFWDFSLFLAVYIAATSLIKLAKGWFRLQEIQKEKTLTELQALKSQINPHFLFNSLNSIYSLSRRSSEILPDVILKLAGLMRYVIYETDDDMVPLEKEIKIIKDYIDLQRLRSDCPEKIELKIEGEPGNNRVAPLIFLPFIENGFKHGLKGVAEDVFVKIKIEITGSVINFEIENSNEKSETISDGKYNGIGIRNVKKRLELIYPDNHLLKISEYKETFKVLLQLQLN